MRKVGDKADVWNNETIIEYSGKRASCQLSLTENIPGMEIIKRNVTIEDGKVIDKPDDVDIIGERTPNGFILMGLQYNAKRIKKCATCEEDKELLDFWDNERSVYSKLCKDCRNNKNINVKEYDEIECSTHCPKLCSITL